MKLIKNILICILLGALVLPASASTIGSWTQTDISGYNLTLNYTSNFSVAKDDTLGIIVNNIGNESINDSITITKINVSETSKATGSWTGSLLVEPNSSKNIDLALHMITDEKSSVHINIYYNVSSDNKMLEVKAHFAGSSAPIITSWANSKTNNNNLSLTINQSESVKFNFTANQTLTSWLWTLNGNTMSNPFDNLTRTFNNAGTYKIRARGSNANGSTNTIIWDVKVLETEGKNRKNATLISWDPQVVDYVEVNGTLNETIEYSITTVEEMTTYNWSVDGNTVNGANDSNTYFYEHTWDNSSVGAHTVSFKGNNSDTKVEFRWYVNVYREGTYSGGNLFDLIDESLENHVTDLKIRMFKYKLTKGNGKSDYAAQKVNQLHNEIAKRQMTREALRIEYKAGNITFEQYVAALKQVQLDAKYNSKLAKGYANIVKAKRDNESEKEFKKISEIEKQDDRKKNEDRRQERKTNNVNRDDNKNNEKTKSDSKNIGVKNVKNENNKKGNGRN
jgi:hypothetical protein